MKDLKINSVQPITDLKRTGKTGPTEGVAGSSFNDELQGSIARMNDLNVKSKGQGDPVGEINAAKPTDITQGISEAREDFDQMMKVKQNLSRLYHNITKSDEPT